MDGFSNNFLSYQFVGNTDPDTVVYHDLAHVQTIRARYIHFSPAAWHGDISMRVELYGCRGTNGLLSPNLLYTQFLSVLQGQLRHL